MKIKTSRPKLRKEITVCLIVKIILLTVLWWVCYRHPFTEQYSAQKVAQIFNAN
jgi:hypothetical protein